MKTITNDNALLAQLSALNIVNVDRPVLSYDNLKRQLVYTFIGRTLFSQEYIIEILIKRTDIFNIENVRVYTPSGGAVSINVSTPFVATAIAGAPFSLTVAGVTETPQTPPEAIVQTYTSLLNRQQGSTGFLLNSLETSYLYSNNFATGFILSL